MHPLISSKLPQLHDLCRAYYVKTLEPFGSATRDDFDPARSDLDFLVEFAPLPTGSRADTYFDFHDELEKLFDCRIDLVTKASIRNPYFAQSLAQSKVPLYAAA
ncbi:MAG TPA: nucleotidyltransferase domain-containing protein [Phycisphaerales bacterium]|nr:nucleotidyltransferase domain-containing protein [Phycisphaerales bacterium]